jgi:endoglucanase
MIKICRRSASLLLSAVTTVACGAASPTEDAPGELDSSLTTTKFFVPEPDPGAVKQIAALAKQRKLADALRLSLMVATPRAVWLTGGTPREVERAVKKTMALAALQKRVPVLVAYDLPYRDCAQYSAGGAVDTAAYQAWIDAFAKGIGGAQALVILEPDSLGIIPYNTTIYGTEEWCKPTVLDSDGNTVPAPGASPAERYAQLQYAAASLQRQAPNASVYVDGTHSAWLGVGEAAYRIHQATHDPSTGASLAHGFFLNVSNFQTTAEATQFGTWVSMCSAFATNPAEGGWRLGNFGWCPSQYNPATGYGLDYSPEYAASVTASLEGLMGDAPAALPFVIDTSRNGRGVLDPAVYGVPPFDQSASTLSALKAGNWCNPPSAGLGPRPTVSPGAPLVDAHLWIKVPGQSDGSCDVAGGSRAWDFSVYNPWGVPEDQQSHFDPLWGMVDPAAGEWFPEQALKLAQQASPPLF